MATADTRESCTFLGSVIGARGSARADFCKIVQGIARGYQVDIITLVSGETEAGTAESRSLLRFKQ